MMKCIRISMYNPVDLEPVTVVMRDQDMKTGIDYAVDENLFEGRDGLFVIVDPFEAEVTEIEDATFAAIERQQERADDEQNMAMLYYWDAMHFGAAVPGGVITTTLPSPLTREQIEYTLKRLADHPDYKNYTIIVHDATFEPVTLRGGKIVD